MKQTFISKTIVLLLTSRVLIDIIFSNQKPQLLIALYTISTLTISAYLILTTKAAKGLSSLVLIFILMSAVLASFLNSNVDFLDHINFSLQILTPIIFLLACSGKQKVLMQSGIRFKKYIAAPALFLILIFSFLDYKQNNLGQSFFDYYANNPNHVFAQTSLKISLLFLQSIPLLIAGFILLGLLNVRSTILALIFSISMFHKSSLLQKRRLFKIVILATIAIILVLSFVDINQILERAVFKNRTAGNTQDIDNLSSGRSEMYAYYVKYLIEKYTFTDWLIGKGPIWLDPKEFNLSAHNDFLNLLVSYGILGFSLISYAYYKFFSTLPKRIRPAASISFIILFLVNGVVFHQSTILFSLLYLYLTPTQLPPSQKH
ncbi:O-antigen ligase family protein [Pseudomonas psychrophila]|uniref:O-antigen ligase like membrane protein n=1 Tax=Pseudomonas psychrophila TaxID=122355 RepID=A0ABY0VXZ6_9PSED|nr:O-antigen ligase family protein [Pseudomonas psychrophila]KAB0489596.1 O-antigen ligase family protein [Pseudomonas psychrophila]KMM98901.1 hypothetical protein TU76_15710 [Pseudomonas psychrophila]QIE33136.1 O-antigen ligase family protein [Pseudomonas psychrophila]WVI99699.1 O-antigen ligase family protein [Pseudomonas psychrophila]SDU57283.1 O-antigen ligase like membrane protein [Pseudomonas psychrophila]